MRTFEHAGIIQTAVTERRARQLLAQGYVDITPKPVKKASPKKAAKRATKKGG